MARQLRGGHVLRVSSASRRTDRPRRRDAPPGREGPRGPGFYRDLIRSAPDELTTIVVLRMAPAAPFLPPWVHGQPVVVVGTCYVGSVEEGEGAVAPLRRATSGPDPADGVRLTPGALRPHRAPRARLLLEIGVRAIAQHASSTRSPSGLGGARRRTYTIIFHLGGAVGRQDPSRRPAEPPGTKMLAVLPFKNLGAAGDEYFSWERHSRRSRWTTFAGP